jgi:hypothetical protein
LRKLRKLVCFARRRFAKEHAAAPDLPFSSLAIFALLAPRACNSPRRPRTGTDTEESAMTRETKVGAVVAISFLSLVGVVVVSKWRNQGADPETVQNAPENPESQAKQQAPPPAPEAKPAPKGPIENARFDQPVLVGDLPKQLPGGEESNNNTNNGLPMLPALEPGVLPPLPAMSEDEKRKQLAEQIARQKNDLPALPPLPGAGQPNGVETTLNNAAAKVDEAKQKTANAVNQGASTLLSGADEFFTRANDKLNKDAAKLDTNAAKVNDTVNGGVQVANDKVNKAANKAEQQLNALINQGNAELNKGVDKINSALPPLPPPPAALNPSSTGNSPLPPLPMPVEANPLLPMPAPPAAPGAPGAKDKLPVLPEPAAINTGVPVPALTSNNPQPPLPAPLPPVTNSDTARPTISAPAPNPVVNTPPAPNPLLNNPVANSPRANIASVPPVIDAKTSMPPIPAPSNVQVRDSETIKYPVKGGETLEAISKARYGSEKYAKAILAYNRDFAPMGTLLTATLQPGQNILLPSADFLEDRYAAAIGAASVAPISINPPIPAPAPPIPMPGAGAKTEAAAKTYRVPAAGQFIFDIAIRTLGDGNRWSEIYRLNPNINPQQPIPGGSELRLPANAKLP